LVDPQERTHSLQLAAGYLQSAALKKILIQTDYDIILAPFDFLVG
jgi:hypothetical protein